MKKLVLGLIHFYQQLPPIWGRSCRFVPTCSEYCYQAVSRYGILQGSLLAGQRILRCHPWSKGGLDPVPTKQTKY